MTERLYHLVAAGDWPGDDVDHRPPSLDTEGFIHLSDASQVPDTSRRYYADVPDLLLVAVDPRQLSAEVRWEDLVGHGDFPHLYGALDHAAVVSVTPYVPGAPVPTGASAPRIGDRKVPGPTDL